MPRITLGPIPFHWSADKKVNFYNRIADEAPIDTVYLGEVICSKRAPFFDQHYDEIAERLTNAGKTVVFSSLSEVMLKRERKAIRDLTTFESFEVEINNAAGLFDIDGRPHRVGPFLNVYNVETMTYLANKGASHVCLPVELPETSARHLAEAGKALGLGVEVQVFGRASLAVSARCYHARAHGRTKDNCQFVCENDTDGMPLNTLDDKEFLRVNGIQTLSHSYVNLVSELPDMIEMGLTDFRLMPQDIDMVDIAKTFAAVRDGSKTPQEAAAHLDNLDFEAPYSTGFWHGQAGHRRIAAASRAFE